MPISHSYKAIFIHIPKNAGESIEKKLSMYGESNESLWGVRGKYVLQHLTMSQMRRMYLTDETFRDYYKFAFVRNPWDKAVSEYHWYLRYSPPARFKNWVRTLSNRLKIVSSLPIAEIGHNVPQYKYIYDKDGSLLVDFVGRFEQLQCDFDKVCRNIGIENTRLEKLESTASVGRKHYREYYDSETIDIIAKVYEKDIDFFNYEF